MHDMNVISWIRYVDWLSTVLYHIAKWKNQALLCIIRGQRAPASQAAFDRARARGNTKARIPAHLKASKYRDRDDRLRKIHFDRQEDERMTPLSVRPQDIEVELTKLSLANCEQLLKFLPIEVTLVLI